MEWFGSSRISSLASPDFARIERNLEGRVAKLLRGRRGKLLRERPLSSIKQAFDFFFTAHFIVKYIFRRPDIFLKELSGLLASASVALLMRIGRLESFSSNNSLN